MMKTPICDFIEEYKKSNKVRFHMPGHKGVKLLGPEANDITEIDGADYLYLSKGIIAQSEENASKLFGFHTFYSTEGSSQCIRAMLFLALTNRSDKINRPYVLATRNAHKTFITAAALMDFDVEWLYKEASTYHSCNITDIDVEEALSNKANKPFAVYLTSPDYLGNILPIEKITKVCKKYNVPLLVDNAHGAYLKFITPSIHPIDLGADMCCDSAHKTLPSLTGAAYLHIANSTNDYYVDHAKEALGLFGSTSPSYLILQSLDKTNLYIANNMASFNDSIKEINELKESLKAFGYNIIGNEKMKITIDAKAFGYTGNEISDYLALNNVISEFSDNDFIVLMPSIKNTKEELGILRELLLKLKRKNLIPYLDFHIDNKKPIMSIREATFAERETICIDDAEGRILADTSVSCPPAIPIVVSGEAIDDNDIKLFKYYGIEKISVVKK